MKLTSHDIDMLEQWWIEKSRKNFLAYRMYLRHGVFKNGWFINDLSKVLQNFYAEYQKGSRPIYIINTPPQHGKSWSIMDFISWIIGLDPSLRIIFSSYAERLGKRCNLALQRTFDLPKYKKIFPELILSECRDDKLQKNSELIEFLAKNDFLTGYFRNTTVEGAITGDTADIGIIDDPVKGRAEARSKVKSENVWEWWEDDFTTRLDDNYGILIIMTRWVTHDLTGRLIDTNKNVKVFNYQAIAEQDEKYRLKGEALFPELKSQEFLEQRKETSSKESWGSLYQGNPTVEGGNLIKDEWWKWWTVLPPIKYKFITADTAQKDKTQHDYSDFKCWGVGRYDGHLYLIDHIRGKWKAPELRKEAEIFFRKHNIPKNEAHDPVLRGIYIEDKSSGSSLIQELRKKKIRVFEVQRNTDKYLRVDDASPYIEMGRVYLNTEINEIGNTLKEAREFPNGSFDDDLDSLITAIEIVYINKKASSNLAAAMAV